MNKLSSYAPTFLSILRVVIGLLFIEHGTSKVLGIPQGAGPHIGLNLTTMPGVAGFLELFGGILIVLGLFTRIAAFILSGEMAVAYFGIHLGLFAHQIRSIYPVVNKGELAVAYCFIFLYFVFAGGGPWSIDALLRRRG